MRDDARRSPVVVFDLDGTILRVNSFPHWVLFLITGRLPGLGLQRRLRLSLQCQWLLLRRKLLRCSHEELRRGLQQAWQTVVAEHAAITSARFEAALLRRVRSNLTSILELVATEQIDAILATAATADYAEGLGRQLGFRHVLAGNSGIRKRERVQEFLAQRGWHNRPMILFTDHIDDLPLMRDSRVVCWFGPAATLAKAAEAAHTRLVYCRDLDSEAACRFLRTLCPNQDALAREMAAS